MLSQQGFDHERLEVYGFAVHALASGAVAARRIRREDTFLRNQLLKALTSVCFNLAEGSGEFSTGDKLRFYRMARRSATESAAIVDALLVLRYATPEAAQELKQLLSRITAMLTGLIRSRTESATSKTT